MQKKFSRYARVAGVLVVAAIFGGIAPAVHADPVYLTVTGPAFQSGFLGTGPFDYNATISYDTSETPSSISAGSATYDATLTFSGAPFSPESGPLTITLNTIDPGSNPADQIEVDASAIAIGAPLLLEDTVDIYAPVGTFSTSLPSVADWQSLISSSSYTADVDGGASYLGIVTIEGYSGGPMTLSVSSVDPNAAAVPAPAAALGAIPLLGLCGWLKRSGAKK